MSDYIIALSKDGKDAREENLPNGFIFHSDYNSFKIIKTGLKYCSLLASTNNQEFTEQHNLTFPPLVTAFAKDDDSVGDGTAFPPNTENIYYQLPKAGLSGTGVIFTKISSDASNVIFTFNNKDTKTHNILVRYFCLESI